MSLMHQIGTGLLSCVLPPPACSMFALAGVGFVTLWMLVNPLAALLMMVCVGMTVLFLFCECSSLRAQPAALLDLVLACLQASCGCLKSASTTCPSSM